MELSGVSLLEQMGVALATVSNPSPVCELPAVVRLPESCDVLGCVRKVAAVGLRLSASDTSAVVATHTRA